MVYLFVAFPEIQGQFLHVACNGLVPDCTSTAPTSVEKATPVTSLDEFSWISSRFFVSYADRIVTPKAYSVVGLT